MFLCKIYSRMCSFFYLQAAVCVQTTGGETSCVNRLLESKQINNLENCQIWRYILMKKTGWWICNYKYHSWFIFCTCVLFKWVNNKVCSSMIRYASAIFMFGVNLILNITPLYFTWSFVPYDLTPSGLPSSTCYYLMIWQKLSCFHHN